MMIYGERGVYLLHQYVINFFIPNNITCSEIHLSDVNSNLNTNQAMALG